MPDGEAAVAKIAGDAEYQKLFQAAYASAPNYDDVGRAHRRVRAHARASSTRRSTAGQSGNAKAMSADAREGLRAVQRQGALRELPPDQLGEPARQRQPLPQHRRRRRATRTSSRSPARRCRRWRRATDRQATIDKLALETDLSELGRFVVTKQRSDIGAFKTEQLRNVGAHRALHARRLDADAVGRGGPLQQGGEANPYLDGGIEPLALSEAEINQLVAFMFALTDARFAGEAAADRGRAARARRQTTRPFRDDDLAHRKHLPFESAPWTKARSVMR